MKTNSIRLTAIILSLSTIMLFNCEQEKKSGPTIDYAFSDKTSLLTCKEFDTLLINEALYSFREDITNYYTDENNNLPLAYRNFTNEAVNGRADYQAMVSDHTKDVFNALKQTPGLWRVNGDSYIFDYDGPFFTCISNKIKDESLKQTITALVATKSINSRMLKEPIRTKTFQLKDDPYLASLVAFDLYYGKLFDVDLSVAPKPKDATSTDSGSHEGHNH